MPLSPSSIVNNAETVAKDVSQVVNKVEGLLFKVMIAYTNRFSSIIELYGYTLLYLLPIPIILTTLGALEYRNRKKKETNASPPTFEMVVVSLLYLVGGAFLSLVTVYAPLSLWREHNMYTAITGSGLFTRLVPVIITCLVATAGVLLSFSFSTSFWLIVGLIVLASTVWWVSYAFVMPWLQNTKQQEVWERMSSLFKECPDTKMTSGCTDNLKDFLPYLDRSVPDALEDQLKSIGGWKRVMDSLVALELYQQYKLVPKWILDLFWSTI